MVWVLPGWALVLARDFRFIRPLIREDFPTLLFPANATSGWIFSGSLLVIPQTVSRLTFFIIIKIPFSFCFFAQNAALCHHKAAPGLFCLFQRIFVYGERLALSIHCSLGDYAFLDGIIGRNLIHGIHHYGFHNRT